MSVHITADTIVAASTSSTSSSNSYFLQSGQNYHRGNNVDDFNSMSNIVETQSLMNSQHHQGRLNGGTPDASNASSMSSNYNNSINQKPEQHVINNNINNTSQAATLLNSSAQDLFSQFHEALALEPKYQPNLFLPQQSNVSSFYFSLYIIILLSLNYLSFCDINMILSNINLFFISKDGEITIGTRDGAAHVLRCLKVWYDLSNDVLFTAINLVDRFLTKMKVRPKHMAVISVGSLHLAIKQLGVQSIDTEDLVAISQVSIKEKENIYTGVEMSLKNRKTS